MGKDIGRYLRAVVVILVTAFCSMKLPHQDKSIFEFLIPAIKISSGARLYLHNILFLALLMWSYLEIVKSKYFRSSKLTIFIIMFFVLVPLTFETMNTVKIPYYMLSGGLKSIDVIEGNYSFANMSDDNTIKVDLKLKNYGKEVKDFNISIELPDSLSKIIDKDTLVLPNNYKIEGHDGILHIQETIQYSYMDGYTYEDIMDTHFFYDEYKIILYNESDRLEIMQQKD